MTSNRPNLNPDSDDRRDGQEENISMTQPLTRQERHRQAKRNAVVGTLIDLFEKLGFALFICTATLWSVYEQLDGFTLSQDVLLPLGVGGFFASVVIGSLLRMRFGPDAD